MSLDERYPHGHGFCACGCGGETRIATRNMHSRGWIKGEPYEYIRGHAMRGRFKLYGYTEEDHGYETPCHIHDGPLVMGYGWERGNYCHRLAFLDRGIEIPQDWTPDHLCEVKACKRFDHLELVTSAENKRRGWTRHPERKAAGTAAGMPWNTPPKTHCPQGHEFTPENTSMKIRPRCRPAQVCKQCAREYAARKRRETKRLRQPQPEGR